MQSNNLTVIFQKLFVFITCKQIKVKFQMFCNRWQFFEQRGRAECKQTFEV